MADPTAEQLHTLEMLESKRYDLHREELELKRIADEAINMLSNNIRLLMILNGGVAMVFQGTFPGLGGLAISGTMMLSFFFGLGLAIIVALDRINTISHIVNDLAKKQRELQKDTTQFSVAVLGIVTPTIVIAAAEIAEEIAEEPSFTAVEIAEESSSTVAEIAEEIAEEPSFTAAEIAAESSFIRHVKALEKTVSTVSNFYSHYIKLLISMTIGATIHGICTIILLYYFLCVKRNDITVQSVKEVPLITAT